MKTCGKDVIRYLLNEVPQLRVVNGLLKTEVYSQEKYGVLLICDLIGEQVILTVGLKVKVFINGFAVRKNGSVQKVVLR